MQANLLPDDYFEGEFVTASTTLKQKLKQVKAFIFDWDGVFNGGRKNLEGNSDFSEVDSMGINMMRFSYFLLHKKLPVTAIITGENNQLAFSFAKREHFQYVYSKAANKEQALMHFCEKNRLSPTDVMFVFDDILDLSVARIAGVRFMIGRNANPLLLAFAKEKRFVDYITRYDGNNYALREISEIVIALSNNFEMVVEHRMKFSEAYKDYMAFRENINPEFYTTSNQQIIST